MANIMSNPKCLIIGGTSSISKEIIDGFINKKYVVHATYRNIEKITTHEGSVFWEHLDLEVRESIYKFIHLTKSYNYDYIVVVASSSTKNEFMDTTHDELSNFYGEYLVNNFVLIRNIVNNLSDNGKLIYISSEAVNKPIKTTNYAISKAALQSFFISISALLKNNQCSVIISPGLIYDTPSFYHTDPIYYNKKPENLITKKQIVDTIMSCNKNNNGSVVRLVSNGRA